MTYRTFHRLASFSACALAFVLTAVGGVELVECPKCSMRIRISDDGRTATVNVSRLKADNPDEKTLAGRIAALKARAEECLRRGKSVVPGDPRCPLMGWSSWNTFGKEISEAVILETARAMATNGLKAAGYLYVNIDDGFFGRGHDASGRLLFHPKRFPNGLKGTVDGIRALGLRAGIYSDAGKDTCGSMWSDNDGSGVGSGLYGYDAADCRLHFNELGFDFIKVDYCGAERQKLEERKRYSDIAAAIAATGRKDVHFNVCRWRFPGTWVTTLANSWRTTYDIRANWKSMRDILAENLYLSAYASPGHFNDLDMLEVGLLQGMPLNTEIFPENKGFSPVEETTHFGMWCMLSSPLLIGCDVRTIPASTLRLVTNPYLLAMNQNNGIGVQGYVVARDGSAYVLAKDADERFGRSRYVALYNADEVERSFSVEAASVDLGGGFAVFDLVERADIGFFDGPLAVKVPAHGAKFYRFDAERRLERSVYEAETAFLSDYQEIVDARKAGTAWPKEVPGASGGVAVVNLGNRPTNDLVWREVKVEKAGRRRLTFACASPDRRAFDVEVDGVRIATPEVGPTDGKFVSVPLEADLTAGLHVLRVSNPRGPAPDFDRMDLD